TLYQGAEIHACSENIYSHKNIRAKLLSTLANP
ncbi:MAG: hypothetical protein ACI8XC_001000, partial [Gammaproteobacteria bacterium]